MRSIGVRLAVVGALVLTTLTAGRAAPGWRIDALRARARQIASEIDANGEHIAALGEQYDGAQYRLQHLRDQERAASRAIHTAQNAATRLRGEVTSIAAR